VRLPPWLGDDTVRLIGSLLLAAQLHTAGGRADLPEDDRLDASLIMDEAHTFAIYNPASKSRREQLARSRALPLERRGPPDPGSRRPGTSADRPSRCGSPPWPTSTRPRSTCAAC
jgi:hypothetical protein